MGTSRWIQLAMLAFPAEFRALHGAEMEEDWAEERVRCETRGKAMRRTLATAFDMVRSGLRERRFMKQESKRVAGVASRSGGMVLDNFLRDLKHSVRALARRPAFTGIAIVTLALGIGANAAMFSVINAVLLRPLEWTDPDGLVMVWAASSETPNNRGTMSLPDTRDIAKLPALETLVGYRANTITVSTGDEPILVSGGRVADGLMNVFRVRPLMGRDLNAADAEMGAPWVVVVSEQYWREQLASRPDVIGSTISVFDIPAEIVGVAPAGFDFPDRAQLWYPMRLSPDGCGRGCHTLYTIGRLASGSTVETLRAQAQTLAATLSEEYPETNFDKQFRPILLADDQVQDVRRGLWFVLGAVALVLLIACANVANLLLVRGESRRGEVAVRTALGASRTRLASQVLAESAVLTIAGTALGLLLAQVAVSAVRTMPEGTVPRIETVSLDGTVLLFAFGLAAFVTLLFGLSPALNQARRLSAADLISERRGGSGVRATRSRSLLLTAELALSVLLLVGAGLLLKSFDKLYRVELGFQADNLTRFRLSLPESRYDSISEIVTFYRSLEERLRAMPGLVSVGTAYGPPLGSGNITGEVIVEGRPPAQPGEEHYGSMHSVTSDYLATVGIPLIRGRTIEESDGINTMPVGVVSETFARNNFPGEDAIGKRFEVTADFGYGSPLWTVVGIVGDVRRALSSGPREEVYVPLGQYGPGGMTVTMRTSPGITPNAASIRDAVRSLDTALPIIGLETVEDAMREEVAPARFYLSSMAIFAGLAVLLACVGLYGVVAYIVSQRGREIGIRLALGAQREQVVRLVLAQGLRPAIYGVVLGLALALALGRVAESLLFDVSPRDPMIMTSAVATLIAVAIAAAWVPAIRASRLDPAHTLRA
jgi:predicted permease